MGLGKILQYVYPKSFVVMRHTPTSQTASWFGQQQTQLDELRKAIADNIKGYMLRLHFTQFKNYTFKRQKDKSPNYAILCFIYSVINMIWSLDCTYSNNCLITWMF